MIKHLFKIVWNRKRTNYLIILEIFFSFLILFGVTIMAVFYLNNFSKPLGFDYKNVWAINMSVKSEESDQALLQKIRVYKQLVKGLAEFNEIQSICGIESAPFTSGDSIKFLRDNKTGAEFNLYINPVTDEMKSVLGLQILSGRWFGKQDNGASYIPMVLNKRAAQHIFGNEDPLGKNFWTAIKQKTVPGEEMPHERRIIGIIDDFRKHGELSALSAYSFIRNGIEQNDTLENNTEIPNLILIKVRERTSTDFEVKLIKRLQAEGKDWSFDVKTLEGMRQQKFKDTLLPLYAFALIAGFLLIMVVLGLSGVLWLNVTRRIREMGLRRACGAAQKKIHRQILGELFVITTIALVAGVLVVVQFPLLNILGFANWKVYSISVIVSVLIIYLITTICGLYPSRMATRVHPAEALHYE